MLLVQKNKILGFKRTQQPHKNPYLSKWIVLTELTVDLGVWDPSWVNALGSGQKRFFHFASNVIQIFLWIFCWRLQNRVCDRKYGAVYSVSVKYQYLFIISKINKFMDNLCTLFWPQSLEDSRLSWRNPGKFVFSNPVYLERGEKEER